jgi:DNA-binding transcriptional ArsR family regulator
MSEPPIDALKAVAHPVRFRILAALADGEHNVGEIEEKSGVAQPTLSQQLAILRKAGLVETRREAKSVYYSTLRDTLGECMQALRGLLPEEGERLAGKPRSRRRDLTGAAVFARLGD